MQFSRRMKIASAIGAGMFVLSGTGVAYAYWTSTGSGSGTANASAGNVNSLVITSTTVNSITPGSTTPITGNINNPNTYSVKADKVRAVITTSDALCLPADFRFADVTVNARIPAAGNQAFSGALVFDDTAVNQDACKSAAITLTYSSTSS